MKNVKMRFILPVFLGCLGALVPCVLIAARQLDVLSPPETAAWPAAEVLPETEQVFFYEPQKAVHFFAAGGYDNGDVIRETYRRKETVDLVIGFFSEICPSREIAEVILFNADKYDIPPALAFALAWEESRMNPRAVNTGNKDGSIDRGLFQLNNRTFPKLEIHVFFDPEVNSKYGMNHLRHCLDTGGSEIAGLAMYNAGTGRVNSSGTPRNTLNYVSRILENRMKIEKRFLERDILFFEEPLPEEIPETVAVKKPERSRLLPLKPLAGR